MLRDCGPPPCRMALGLVLAVAVAARTLAVAHWHQRLTEDRDGYLAIAAGLVQGLGYADPATGEPTAYRPPLYPLMIAALNRAGGGAIALGIAQIVLGTLTVLGTFLIGRRLGMSGGALLAAGLVAVDPLLVQYTSYAMTETLFAFLTTALLMVALNASGEMFGGATRRAVALGGLFGLCALCRPTVWAFGALIVGWEALCAVRERASNSARRAPIDASATPPSLPSEGGAPVKPLALGVAGERGRGKGALARLWTVLAAILVLAPWTIRNLTVFGTPIVTTTHGGYTLLLANNPVVYREEVDQPWGTTWDDAPPGRRQSDWHEGMREQMRSELGDAPTEKVADRWMSRQAWSHIRSELATFARACWLRVRRLWNIVPLSPAAGGLPRFVVWGVGGFYATVFALAAVGLARLGCSERRAWMPLLMLVMSVTLVHAVYWSNARMRAPLMPAVALLAARGVLRTRPMNGDAA